MRGVARDTLLGFAALVAASGLAVMAGGTAVLLAANIERHARTGFSVGDGLRLVSELALAAGAGMAAFGLLVREERRQWLERAAWGTAFSGAFSFLYEGSRAIFAANVHLPVAYLGSYWVAGAGDAAFTLAGVLAAVGFRDPRERDPRLTLAGLLAAVAAVLATVGLVLQVATFAKYDVSGRFVTAAIVGAAGLVAEAAAFGLGASAFTRLGSQTRAGRMAAATGLLAATTILAAVAEILVATAYQGHTGYSTRAAGYWVHGTAQIVVSVAFTLAAVAFIRSGRASPPAAAV